MSENIMVIPAGWEKRRTRTFIGFIFEATALGMEYSLTFITLWLYLKEIHVVQINLYYSLVSAAYLSSQVVSSIIFGYIADKYRCVRELFIICNSLVAVGNILYTIPLSPWWLVSGRLISGGGGCVRCIMTGELARSYPHEELSSKFSLMGMAFGLGFVVGPAINFPFLKCDFYIGPLHVWYANVPGLNLSVLFVLLQLLSMALISNLSKEYDLKTNTVAMNEEVNEESGDEKRCNTEDYKEDTCLMAGNDSDDREFSLLSSMFKNIDTTLILFLSFLIMYCIVSFDLWQPRAVLELNGWTVQEINIIIFGYGILVVIVLFLVSAFPMSDVVIVYMSMVCTLCIILINIIFIVFTLLNYSVLNVVLWTCYDIFFALLVIMEEVFLIGVMAKMTASCHQSLAESIRLGFSRSGALVALLTAAASFEYLMSVCTGLAACGGIGIVLIIWRRKRLQDPQIVIE